VALALGLRAPAACIRPLGLGSVLERGFFRYPTIAASPASASRLSPVTQSIGMTSHQPPPSSSGTGSPHRSPEHPILNVSAKDTPAGQARAFQADSTFSGKHLYFIGIGGSGMSGLAQMLAVRGARCSGSDSQPSELTATLAAQGMHITTGAPVNRLPERCDLVIASAAIRPDHPEVLAAEARGINVISYAEALGLAQCGRTAVSIAGTHGKSTTTAMLAHILIEAGFDPSVIVGATCSHLGGGSRTGSLSIPVGPHTGKPGILVCEACEFNRSFHHHRPTIGLINNVEEDHLDCYTNIDAIVQSFREFAELLPPMEPSSDDCLGGKLLIADEGAHRREITAGLRCEVSTFGFSPMADFQVFFDAKASRAGVLQDGVWLGHWDLAVHGDHMALNSAAAAIMAHWLGVEWEAVAAALPLFRGVDRRMQRLGSRRAANAGDPADHHLSSELDVVVYDDYGHHPTECEKTLRALRAFENPKRLICVFQPHQHSRTRFLLDQFATSFSSADIVIVPQIYFVRDSEIEKTRISANDLVEKLRARHVDALHIAQFDEIVDHLEEICRPGDLVVVMGAGPVNQIANEYLRRANAHTASHGGSSPRDGVVAAP
jgi:UDP-N-acetylmuramate--alanine ligase